MRFLSSTVAAVLLSVAAATQEAQVYLSDSAAQSYAISPETARLVFAQRLGLGETEKLQEVDDATITTLNNFGGRPQKLFGQDERPTQPKVFFLIDNVKDAKGDFDCSWTTSWWTH